MSTNIEQYKAYIQDLGNIGLRHENSRRFYLSVLLALFVLLSLAGENGFLIEGYVLKLVVGVGIILCLFWFFHMSSFGVLYFTKFKILRNMEEKCDFFPVFNREHTLLEGKPYSKLMTRLDSYLPLLFLLMFFGLLFAKGASGPPAGYPPGG